MTGHLVQQERLTHAQRAAMFALLHESFEGVTREVFEADLAQKNWVILLTDMNGGLTGFSTLLIYERRDAEGPATVVYSGDTIVAPRAWGSSALSSTWIAAVHAVAQYYGNRPIYWLLITSGFRTYRFLPVFFRAFYPCHDRPTPEAIQRIIHDLANERFGCRYNPATGIVRLDHPEPLRDALRMVPETRLSDPHIAFFLQRNPGHGAGDELVCLADLAESNLTAAGRRMIALGRTRLGRENISL